jgi:hypothetical protein
MMNLQSDKAHEQVDDGRDDSKHFPKAVMYNKISKKEYQYLQAMTTIQDDILDSCNGLLKKQVDTV